MRRLVLGLLVAAGVVALTMLGLPASGASTVVAQLDSVHSEYVRGQPVTLRIKLANAGESSCRVNASADGMVAITSLRRDGAPVLPVPSQVLYEDDPAAMAGVEELAAGAELALTLASVPDEVLAGGVQALRTVNWSTGGLAVANSWSVSEPGNYEVAVAITMPDTAATAPSCRGVSTANARFTVSGASSGGRDDGGLPSWLVPVLLVAGGLLLATGGWVVWRRHRRPASRVAGSGLGLIVMCASGLLITEPSQAHATIDSNPSVVSSGPDQSGFQTMFDRCLGSFRAPGGDPTGIMSTLDHPAAHITVMPVGKHKDAISSTNAVGVSRANIYWAWWIDPPYMYKGGDGVYRDPCSSLYHELAHAYDMARGIFDPSWCSDTGMSKAEARAMHAENAYRATHKDHRGRKLPKRTKCGSQGNVPDSLDECQKPPTRNWGPLPTGETGEECETGCASTDGDPHLRTFDGFHYDFQAAGEFDAVMSADGSVRVQARQQPLLDSDSVSVNTAIAMKVAETRVEVLQPDGRLKVLVDGAPSTDDTSQLPGGGTVHQWTRHDTRYVLVGWPDGSKARIRPIGTWGLAMEMALDQRHRGHVSGLLGNYDGRVDNDLVTRDGQATPDISFPALYQDFGESWRISQQDSLFTYRPGQDTRTFTDQDFPREYTTAADLPNRQPVETICRQLGVTMPALLDACVLDLGLTGQASFAGSAVETQTIVDPGDADPGESSPGTSTVQPGDTIRDGDIVDAVTTTAAQRHVYPLDLGDATVFRLVDVTGESGQPGIELIGPTAVDTPGFAVTDAHLHRVQPGARYQLAVTGPDNPGRYGFRLITHKDRRLQAEVDHMITAGQLDVPGRVDLYELKPTTNATSLRVADATPCDDVYIAFVEDGHQPRAYTPVQLCWDIALGTMEPGKRYLIAVWSANAKTTHYGFRVSGQ